MCPRKQVISILKLLLISFILNSALSINFSNEKSIRNSPDSELTFTELAGKYGYPAEKHLVTTKDGYILTVFRIRGRYCGNEIRRPLLLMHGLQMSSDAFLDAGPGSGLAYLLADVCHDVWVGNSRGNYNSRSHVTLNPDTDGQFWQFSTDEMGIYDQPSTIDYILEKTEYDTLNYVGFSQGAGMALIMCSERPSYCDKLNIFIALAPSSRHLNTGSRLFRSSCINFNRFERVFARAGIFEVFGKTNSYSFPDILSTLCQFNTVSETICRALLYMLDSYHSRSVARSTIKSMYGHFMAGTSVHNMARFGQSMVSEDFHKFDYGAENFRIYGSRSPPKYNMSATTIPVVVVYGENDGMVDRRDVQWLVSQLPNVLEVWLVPDPNWNHLDTVYSQYAAKLIFPIVQKYLLQYS